MKHIRLWTLGDLDKNILPTPAAMQRLRDILSKIDDGALDLIWGPDLSVKCIGPDSVERIIPEETYNKIMELIDKEGKEI